MTNATPRCRKLGNKGTSTEGIHHCMEHAGSRLRVGPLTTTNKIINMTLRCRNLQFGNKGMSTEGIHHRMEHARSWLRVGPLTTTKNLFAPSK
jgi:hypothetical protein